MEKNNMEFDIDDKVLELNTLFAENNNELEKQNYNENFEYALSFISLIGTVVQIIKKVSHYQDIAMGDDIIELYKDYLTDYDLPYKLSAYIDESGLNIKLLFDEDKDNVFTECNEDNINQMLEKLSITVEKFDKNIIVKYSKIEELEKSNSSQRHL